MYINILQLYNGIKDLKYNNLFEWIQNRNNKYIDSLRVYLKIE